MNAQNPAAFYGVRGFWNYCVMRGFVRRNCDCLMHRRLWYAWRRPTLPLSQYHWRWSVSRPSSGWDRVGALRHNHQANEGRVCGCGVSGLWAHGAAFSRRPRSWALINENNQADRAISTGKLRALLRFHTQPINVVVFHGSHARPSFEAGFPLRCLQRLSIPHIATLHCGWRHNRSTRDVFTPVLSY